MDKNDKTQVSIPRWHYRDTQIAVNEILMQAEEKGNLQAAMVEFIQQRQDKLPEGITAEEAVANILQAVDGFTLAHSAGKSIDDIKAALQSAVKEMNTQQALAYLTALETTFRVCDLGASDVAQVPSAEELQAEIKQAIDGASGDDVSARIERLADAIIGDSLKTYIYASGNEELTGIFSEMQSIDASGGLDDAAAARLRAMLSNKAEKTKVYAATACACYGAILDGKVNGMSADKVDIGVMTSLVVAGMEKSSILMRLARGEIDMALACDLFNALIRCLKWVLVKFFQASILLIGSTLGLIAVDSIFALIGITLSSWILFPMAFIIGTVFAIDSKATIEQVLGTISSLAAIVTRFAARVLSCVWNKTRELGSKLTGLRTNNQTRTNTAN